MVLDAYVEFSIELACRYGLEIAIIHGFFKHYQYLSSIQDKNIPEYPSVENCLARLKFWDEDKIRELISQLYLKKLH